MPNPPSRLPSKSWMRPTTGKVREALISTILPFLPGARVLDLFAGTGSLGLAALENGAQEAVFVESDSRSLKYLAQEISKRFPEEAARYAVAAKHALHEASKRQSQGYRKPTFARGATLAENAGGDAGGNATGSATGNVARNAASDAGRDATGDVAGEVTGNATERECARGLSPATDTNVTGEEEETTTTCRIVFGKLPQALVRLRYHFDIILADPPYNSAEGPATLAELERFLSPDGLIVFEHHHKEDYPEIVGHLALSKRKRYGETCLSYYQVVNNDETDDNCGNDNTPTPAD